MVCRMDNYFQLLFWGTGVREDNIRKPSEKLWISSTAINVSTATWRTMHSCGVWQAAANLP